MTTPRTKDGSINIRLAMLQIVGAYPDNERERLLRELLRDVWADGYTLAWADAQTGRADPFARPNPYADKPEPTEGER